VETVAPRLFSGVLTFAPFEITHFKHGAACYNSGNKKICMRKHGVYGSNVKVISTGVINEACLYELLSTLGQVVTEIYLLCLLVH
jgi:hypothetical protein